ncbi:MAG: TauD/TfdA family dioxygenase [Gammaproteobacteria bacterium]|nr:TauD/TfdA family dioxygenase [Gammaproteobacteria bacterium]
MRDNPFLLENEVAYQAWREQKLADYPSSIDQLKVNLTVNGIDRTQIDQLERNCRKTNFVIYCFKGHQLVDKPLIKALGEQLGLKRLDGNLCADGDSISSLQVREVGRHSAYIPYTNRRLSWHTDGYYNRPDQQIRGILMHCAQDAAEGGENLLLDHEIAYIQLRDINPDYIQALMQGDAMTIPPNIEQGVEIRGEQSGPVFSLQADAGNLHMRYTARNRNIEWKDNAITHEAVACLTDMLTPNNPYVFRYRLKPGEGIICNNILHCRTGFTDDAVTGRQRLLYRARYFDRVEHTDLDRVLKHVVSE